MLPETAEHDLLRKDSAADSDNFCALAIWLMWVVLTGMRHALHSQGQNWILCHFSQHITYATISCVQVIILGEKTCQEYQDLAAALLHLLELLEQPVWHARLAPTRGPKSYKDRVSKRWKFM